MPSEPQSPQTERIQDSPNDLLVSWQCPAEPNSVMTSYKVYCSKNNSSTNEDDSLATKVVNGDATETAIGGLTPYTYYDCYVTANTSIGEGNTSETTTASTDDSSK